MTRDHLVMEQRRVQAAALFEMGAAAPEVGRRLQVSRQVAYRWKAAWLSGGEAGLMSRGRAGRKLKLNPEQIRKIKNALHAGTSLTGSKGAVWTLQGAADLIQTLTGLKYHPGHVWRLLSVHDRQVRRESPIREERLGPHSS
jgi:transposase